MEILNYYFEMLDTLLESEYNNEISSEFETKIYKFREKLKDTFDNKAQNYTQFCLTVDKYFDEYLDSKK